MISSSRQNILQYYSQLPPKLTTYVHYQNHNIREKDINGQLERLCLIYAIYLSVHSAHCQHPFSKARRM